MSRRTENISWLTPRPRESVAKVLMKRNHLKWRNGCCKNRRKWGFADKDGNVIIEAKYDEARSFSNGLAAVREGETWGYINAENETAIEFAFTDCKDFNNHGCSFAKDGEEWVLIKLLEKNH